MTQSSQSRILRKKPALAQNTSLGAQNPMEEIKGFVKQQVGASMQQLFQAVQQFVLQERAAIQTRQMAFERILKANVPWFNEEFLALEVANVEDEIQGLQSVTDEVKAGDKVRCTFLVKNATSDEWSDSSRLAIHQVFTKGPDGNYQTFESLESALLGLKPGDTRQFTDTEKEETVDGKPPEELTYKVTVMRISRNTEAK